jgi:regulatory protein
MPGQKVTQSEALSKLQRYCSTQDRCHQEVRSKLLSLGLRGDMLEEVIIALIQDDFLNEERFARSFVRGKFRMNGWGRNKIIVGLRRKGVPQSIIDIALDELEDQDYKSELIQLLEKKRCTIRESDPWKLKQKLFAYAASRGYESGLISTCLRELSDSF